MPPPRRTEPPQQAQPQQSELPLPEKCVFWVAANGAMHLCIWAESAGDLFSGANNYLRQYAPMDFAYEDDNDWKEFPCVVDALMLRPDQASYPGLARASLPGGAAAFGLAGAVKLRRQAAWLSLALALALRAETPQSAEAMIVNSEPFGRLCEQARRAKPPTRDLRATRG